jgi:hypothetical protein
MLLQISGERLLRDVQKDFNRAYPFLKIEFFKNDDVRKAHYPVQKQLSPSLKITDARYKNVFDGEVEVMDNMSVSDLENKFMDLFGLSIQVFRRSGNLWLETSMTDNWSLKQQNENGEEISVAKPRL